MVRDKLEVFSVFLTFLYVFHLAYTENQQLLCERKDDGFARTFVDVCEPPSASRAVVQEKEIEINRNRQRERKRERERYRERKRKKMGKKINLEEKRN